MPKLNISNVLSHLMGKTRFSLGSGTKEFITSNPQCKKSLGEVIDRNGWRKLPIRDAVDQLLQKYGGLEATIRKASTNIDIPGVFRDAPLDPIPGPAGNGGGIHVPHRKMWKG